MAQVKKAPQSGNSGDASDQKTHCCVEACRSSHARFGFCEAHFDEFKFGLIKKNGHKVPDYDKKFDHYQAYLRAQRNPGVKKAA